MVQRGLMINGMSVAGATGAKKIVMTEFDKACAALPGFKYDMDMSRIPAGLESPFIRHARGADSLLVAQGVGYSTVESSHINGLRALRLDGSQAHREYMTKGLKQGAASLMIVASLGQAIRTDAIATTKVFAAIFNGSTYIFRIRFNVTTGNLTFSVTESLAAVTVARASLPAQDTPAIFTFCHDPSDGFITIDINNTVRANGTDLYTPPLSEDKPIHVGSVLAPSANQSFSGDILHVIPFEGSHIIRDAPEQFAKTILLGKAEFGIA